jgi:hypothetical protein
MKIQEINVTQLNDIYLLVKGKSCNAANSKQNICSGMFSWRDKMEDVDAPCEFRIQDLSSYKDREASFRLFVCSLI